MLDNTSALAAPLISSPSLLASTAPLALNPQLSRSASGRNVVIFVADGLRAGSVNPTDAPTLYSIQQQGVNFSNSHSLFPTFTTPQRQRDRHWTLPRRHRRLQQYDLRRLPRPQCQRQPHPLHRKRPHPR